jgi:hypothetical protein
MVVSIVICFNYFLVIHISASSILFYFFTYDLNTLYLFFVVLVSLELKMNSQDFYFF